MDQSTVQQILISQYRASLAMLKQTIEACPDEMWTSDAYHNRFWHIAYHALFYTHLYLQPSEAEFRPWAKYQPDSQYLSPRPWAPDEPVTIPSAYSRDEVLEYCEFCHAEVAAKVPAINLDADSGFSWLPFNRLGVHLYNIRHIQHHAGQLADRLRTAANIGTAWVRMG